MCTDDVVSRTKRFIAFTFPLTLSNRVLSSVTGKDFAISSPEATAYVQTVNDDYNYTQIILLSCKPQKLTLARIKDENQ